MKWKILLYVTPSGNQIVATLPSKRARENIVLICTILIDISSTYTLYFIQENIAMSKFQKFSDIKKRALKDPAVKAAYDALEPEYKLAESIIRARLAKKLTQVELAKRAGVSQTVIARIESGTNNPTISTVSRVANALGKEIRLVTSQT
jgi:DNA-binding XRE family transcriptional regulator